MFKPNFKRKLDKKPSFTLVEVLVAMIILMMLIGGMVRIEISNIRLADSGKKQLQAAGLARGGLNLVRTIRDTNILTTNPNIFDGITVLTPPTVPTTPQYLKKTGDTWSLTTTSTEGTYYRLGNNTPIDGTTYTVEVTITN